MKNGDRVKLTRVLALKMHARSYGHRKVDWRKRRGTILSVARFTDTVSVKWDDRDTADHWPERALEVIHEP